MFFEKGRLVERAGLAVLAGSVSMLVGVAASAQTIDMKIGFVTIKDPQHDAANMFVAEVAKRTKGRINGRVFPAAQLGKIPRQIEGLQLGTQEGFISPPGFFAGINPALQVTDAPAMFATVEAGHAAITHPSFRDKFLNLANRAGVVGVAIWGSTLTAIASRDPIRTLDDMKGKKIRVLASKMEVELMKQFGIAGIPMPYSEVLPAIQRRTIDGARSAHTVMGTSKFFTAAKYITFTQGGFIPSGLFMSKVWLQKIPADLRKQVMDSGRAIEDRAAKRSIAFMDDAWKLWTDNGAEVIKLSAKDQAEFMRRAKPLGDKFLGTNPKTKDMYNLLKQAAAKTRK